MAVQAGIWNADGKPASREFLVRTGQTLAEYGPDGEMTFVDGPIGMLYRPFHTTTESRLEHQPYVSPRGKVLTWDGRLDNRDELIWQLRDVLKDDRTDVALVATAFDHWGTNCFRKLTGDWGISIWCPDKQELVLARDYIGVRHLFYYIRNKQLIWCNHLSSLALSGDQFTLCEEYIAGYFRFWPESHLTPYNEIHSVAAGSFVCISDGRVDEHSYWTFNPTSKTRYKSDDEYEENFRHLLRQSVRRRLRTDSPILAELSGGLDSSSIVCMADDVLAKEAEHVSPLDTFSSYDSAEPDEHDFSFFRKVEERRGRVGHHADLSGAGDTLRFDYTTLVATPGFEERAEFNAAESKVIERGKYRVLFSGDGGDFILGQDRDPRVQMADMLIRGKIGELNRLLCAWSLSARRPWLKLLFQAFVILLPTPLRMRLRPMAKLVPWLNVRFARRHVVTHRLLPAAEGKWLWLPSIRESFQIVRNLAGLMTSIRPSVIEKRYPFLDQTLTEFLTSIPADQLLRPGERRSLQRRALFNLLPKEISSRQIKSGAGRCYVLTLKKHWGALENILSSPLSVCLGYVQRGRFEAALLAMRSGHANPYGVQLLKTLSLELWLRDMAARGIILIPDSAARDIGVSPIRSSELYV